MMNFFVNKRIGHGNSGVEHAQFYRAQCFREKNMVFKLIYTDYLPELHEHMKEWRLKENEVIGLYDYLLSDNPSEYLQNGLAHTNVYRQQTLVDFVDTQRVVHQQTTGQYQATILKSKRFDSKKNVYLVGDDRVILENGQHRVTWHYRHSESLGKIMTNIHVSGFHDHDYLFATFEELLMFFLLELQREFTHNCYFIDRGTDNEEVLITLKNRGYQLKIVDIVHAAHLVSYQNNRPVWNNYYQYMFDHLDDVDRVIVATTLQQKDILSQLRDSGFPVDSHKIIAIPVGGVNQIAAPKKWAGNVAKFVTVSRLHPEKKIAHIVESIAQLNQKGFAATLSIYGTGNEEDKLKQLINDYHLNDKITLKGFCQSITRELLNYDAYVSASYSEGFGLTYIEALGAALPVASYANLYGAQSLIKDGKNGHLAEFDRHNKNEAANIAHLSAAMQLIFTDYDSLSEGATLTAENFQIKKIADQWARVVEGLS
jgi:poly(glycerol-phosphate) alpha-glucosyltransferase